MSYPDYPQLVGSRPFRLSGKQGQRAVSGRYREQALYTSTQKGFEVVHELTLDEYQTWLQYIEDNKENVFNFTWALDGQTYSCRIDASQEPTEEPLTGIYIRVTIRLVVV